MSTEESSARWLATPAPFSTAVPLRHACLSSDRLFLDRHGLRVAP